MGIFLCFLVIVLAAVGFTYTIIGLFKLIGFIADHFYEVRCLRSDQKYQDKCITDLSKEMNDVRTRIHRLEHPPAPMFVSKVTGS